MRLHKITVLGSPKASFRTPNKTFRKTKKEREIERKIDK
jgi:hypothetical protein